MTTFSVTAQTLLTKEQLAAIGCVAIESTYAEAVIEEIIWALCGLDEAHGKHLTTGVQLSNRLELLGALAKLHTPKEHQPRITKIISDFKIATSDRNTIIHGLWVRTLPDGSLAELDKHPDPKLSAKAEKRRLNLEPLVFSADSVMKVAQTLCDLRADLVGFVEDSWPAAWQRISQPQP
jgi:hypothetical protein